MISVRRSEERGQTQNGWLNSRHSFSFGQYQDPTFEGFGSLRVINEDWIKAGAGFPPHPHQDMEIVTYLLSGAISHRDSTGGGGTIGRGEIQRMSAGSGIVHAEYNASKSDPCHLLQIWILPSRRGITPGYEQKLIDGAAIQNHFARIAAPEPRQNEIRLVQDAEIWAARLDGNVEAIHPLTQGRKAWIQVASGSVNVDRERLEAGDGAAITDQTQIAVRSNDASEVLLFDLA